MSRAVAAVVALSAVFSVGIVAGSEPHMVADINPELWPEVGCIPRRSPPPATACSLSGIGWISAPSCG